MVDLAREAFITNNFDLAAEMYEITIREKGPKSELYLGLADSFARGGQFSKAFSAYTNAYRLGRVTPEKLKHLVTGLIDTVKQDHPKTKAQSKTAMFSCGLCRGLFSDPVTLPCGHTFCRKCLSKDKSETCEICDTVHYNFKLKKRSSNVVLVNLVEKLFPDECTANRLKREGNQCFEKRDFKKAIKVYSMAIEKVPEDHLIYSNRCHAYASLDQFSEALADAEKVVSLRPDWPKGYFRKGSALYGLGQYEDAVVAFLQCLGLDPKVTSARDQLSKALDKILSQPSPDDPKAVARCQETNPSMLHQLIQQNFSSSLLMSALSSTLSDVMVIVQDTVNTAHSFNKEQLPSAAAATTGAAGLVAGNEEEDEELVAASMQKYRCSSLPDCSSIDHEDLQRATLPRSYSPLPKALSSRKRMRNPSSSQCPFSPTHISPQKFPKPAFCLSGNEAAQQDASSETRDIPYTQHGSQPRHSNSLSSTSTSCAETVKPELLNVEDLECSLCYRLFFEPITTPCGHTFCRKCLDRCLDHTVSCPMCKGNMAEYLAERRHAVTDAIQSIIETYLKDEYQDRCRTNDEEMVELARMGSEEQSEIPVFVCTISFPSLSCPLHIFEPRYRLMIRQCMESGTRQFGMCLQSSDNNDNSFVDYGCMLEVRDVQYFADGRSLVDTIGGRRFKVLERGQRDGYNTAKVEFIKDTPIPPEDLPGLCSLQEEIHGKLQKWLSSLSTFQRDKICQMYGQLPPLENLTEPSPNGLRWCWWALAVLPFTNQRVQLALMAMVCLKERLSALKKIMDHVLRHSKK